MKRTIELQTRAWAAAGPLTWDFSTIDDEVGDELASVKCVILEFRMAFTCGAGGGCTGRELHEWIQSVDITGGPFVKDMCVNVNGWDLPLYLFTMENVLQLLADDADADASYTKVIIIFIPTCSDSHEKPEEHYPPGGAFKRCNLVTMLGGAAVNANTTMTSCEVDVVVKLHRGHTARFAHFRCIRSIDKERQHDFEPGTFHGMCLVNPSPAWAAADLTRVRLVADGDVYHQQVTPDAVIESYIEDMGYNEGSAGGGFLGATAQWTWDTDYADLYVFPIIWLSADARQNRTSQLVGSKAGPLVDLQGAATSFRYVYGFVPPLKSAFTDEMIRELGAEPEALKVGRTVTPGQVGRRPSLSSVPFEVTGSVNLSKTGRLGTVLGNKQVFKKIAAPDL